MPLNATTVFLCTVVPLDVSTSLDTETTRNESVFLNGDCLVISVDCVLDGSASLCTETTSRSGDCLVISAVGVLDVSTHLCTRDTASSKPLNPWVVPLDASISLCTETDLSELLSRDGDCLIIFVKDIRLKRYRGIRKLEWQNLVFEVIITSPECNFSFIILRDAKPIICSSEVQLGVSFDHGESINQFFNKRKRVPVFDRNYIQSSIIYAEP